MRKIISLFKRNYAGDRQVYDEVIPGAEWVPAGEGVATRKYDGSCCMIDEAGSFYKRYELNVGKTPPPNFLPACEVDPVTGKQQGWVPVDSTKPEDRYFREGFDHVRSKAGKIPETGTYELVGPKVLKNPDKFTEHTLVRHGRDVLFQVPTDFEGIKNYLTYNDIEGVVWHHNDGRMVKIKAKDFGIKR